MDHVIVQPHASNLQHLRRIARPVNLPVRLHQSSNTFNGNITGVNTPSKAVEAEDTPGSSPIKCHEAADEEAFYTCNENAPQTLYLLICAVSVIALENLSEILSSVTTPRTSKYTDISIISVPAYPPTSEEQAKQWSQDYWPTVYKKHHPNGPHPSIVFRAEEEIKPLVGKWMALAAQVGLESFKSSIGESIGAVIVDRSKSGEALVAVVTGDARWLGRPIRSGKDSGNVMAHPVMRAIGLIARKRRMLLQQRDESQITSKTFLDYPLTETERTFFALDTLQPGGYLCTELEIYLTHEPCVMCSMAILHSRFTKVIFGRSMPRTGGLTAEMTDGCSDGPRYGLFWLHELNWKLLAWNWINDHEDQIPPIENRIHA